jgi:hypothetical protein
VLTHDDLQIVAKDAKFKNIKSYTVILFNDMLLWGTAKSFFSSGSVEGVLPCHEIQCEMIASSQEYVAKHQFKVTSAQGREVVLAAPNEVKLACVGF